MLRRSETRVYNISVVGLSGTEKEKGTLGIGKSCLCNRFIRTKADDYYPEHISVLSVTDFSGRIINNDHFLYWGYTTKNFEDSPEIGFNIVEQTEFIDDATFQAFKGGKMEPYIKRSTSTRLYSAEKLMYICKSQLGIEKEYEQKILPDGKLFIDGFVVVYDVSSVPGRSSEKQTEFSAMLINAIIRQKKPFVIATTKNDESCDAYIKEVEKLVNRKEYKNINIPIIETSAHENINVDNVFLVLQQCIEKVKSRIRVLSYQEMYKIKKETLDNVSETFFNLIQSNVVDHRSVWVSVCRELVKYPAFMRYIELFGEDHAQRLYRRHIKKLKDEYIIKRERKYLEKLPIIIKTMFQNIPEDDSWDSIISRIKDHPDCSLYFVQAPSGFSPETDWTSWGSESSGEIGRENRIPLELLRSEEARGVWLNILNNLNMDRQRSDHRLKFKLLLDNTPYVTPGKLLNELQVLFMGHECFESLTGLEIQQIYEQHQLELINKAKVNFIELLLENSELFNKTNNISPNSSITQNEIREIIMYIQDDNRYKMLDRMDQERRLLILQHLGFVHCPIREHCVEWNKGGCMESKIERILEKNMSKLNAQQHLSTQDILLTLYLIGAEDLVQSVQFALMNLLDDEEYELDGTVYTVEIILNNYKPLPIQPPGNLQTRLVLYSSSETLEDAKENLEKTLLYNLAEENLPFIEPPVIIVYLNNNNSQLFYDGENLAQSLGCGFVDLNGEEDGLSNQLLAEAMQSLVRSLRERQPLKINRNLNFNIDINIIMCVFCGDNYNLDNLINPLFTLPNCQQSSSSSINVLTFLGEKRRGVKITFTSYHGATAHRDSLIHGLILTYSTNRLASFSTLKTFSNNVPNLPILILAISENSAAQAMFQPLGQKLLTEGNSLADELHSHFTTWNGENNIGIYTQFMRQVYEQKTDIERAFRMTSPTTPDEEIYEELSDSGSCEQLLKYTTKKVGKLNISEYSNVTDVLNKMKNPIETRSLQRRPQRVQNSTTDDESDVEQRPMRKKKVKSNTNVKKSIFMPIPTVPKGFVPYQLTKKDSAPRHHPIDEVPREVQTEKKYKKEKKKPVKIQKSKSQDQQLFGTLEQATQPNGLLDRCISFIEEEGLEMEGLYRVPGNRAHVDTLFTRLQDDLYVDIKSLDIPVNAVATALKDFLAKKLPTTIPPERMGEVERVSLLTDRSFRLLELKKFLHSLPPTNFKVLKLIFQHLVKVSENSKINSMDSKNLAICWWPTLLPFTFIDMFKFEQMRPYLEDLIQNMIDQFAFLFLNREDVVMV